MRSYSCHCFRTKPRPRRRRSKPSSSSCGNSCRGRRWPGWPPCSRRAKRRRSWWRRRQRASPAGSSPSPTPSSLSRTRLRPPTPSSSRWDSETTEACSLNNGLSIKKLNFYQKLTQAKSGAHKVRSTKPKLPVANVGGKTPSSIVQIREVT